MLCIDDVLFCDHHGLCSRSALSAMLDLTQIQAIFQGGPPERIRLFSPPLIQAMEEFSIETPLQQAHFLSQVAHESGCLRWLEEIWGPTPAQLTYEGRRDLGNTQPGDGYRFRGFGPIQITGRANVTQLARAIGEPSLLQDPSQLTQPELGSRSAGWFWMSRNLNPLAERDDLRAITRVINGGLNGLNDRAKYLHRAKQLLMGNQPGQLSRILRVQSPMLSGPDVEAVQRALNPIYPSDPLVVDGWYVPQTERRVRRFQQDHDLTVDGIVGMQTWQKLIPANATSRRWREQAAMTGVPA